MDAPLRLLLVADPAAAGRAVEPVRRHVPVEAALAPTAAVLEAALRDAAWDAVLLVRGGPVPDADVARTVAAHTAAHTAAGRTCPPLVVVGPGGVPAHLAGVAALALDDGGLEALPFVLASLAAEAASGTPAAFVAAANAALAESGRATAALPDTLAAIAAEPAAAPPGAFVGTANASLAESARATAALPDALADAAHADAAQPPRPTPPPADAPRPATPRPPAPLPDAPLPELRPHPADPAGLSSDAESLAGHLPIGVYRSSPDGRILYANPALADVLGLDNPEALARLDVGQMGYPRDAFTDELKRNGSVRNLTVRWTNPRGLTVYTRENARAVLDARGQVVCYEGTMEDVTAEVEVRQEERMRARHHEAVVRFAEAADGAASPDALFDAAVRALHDATQADWVLLVRHDVPDAEPGDACPGDAEPGDACPGDAEPGDACPGDAAPVVPPQGRNVVAAWAGRFPASGAAMLSADPIFARMPVVPEPVLLRDVDSTKLAWLPESIASLMRTHAMRGLGCFPLHRAGQPLGALVVGYDTPHTFSQGERQAAEVLAWHLAGHLARHRAEASLRDSEASLRFIAARSSQVLYRLRYAPADGTADGMADGTAGDGEADAPSSASRKLHFDYLSPAVETLTGYAPDDLRAAGGLSALVEERDVFAGAGLFDGPTPDAALYHALYRLRTKDGGERWVENHACPWHDADGVPVGLVGALHDVTERKRREDQFADAAQQALARQSALVEIARIDAAESVFARTAELACEAAGADAASVWLVDGPWMVCRALHRAGETTACQTGSADGVVTPAYPVDAFEAALGELHGQRSLAVHDAATDALVDRAGFRPLVAALGLRAFVASPVRRASETVGMVVVHRTAGPAADAGTAATPEPWTDAETEFAGALADAVALAVERDERTQAEGALRLSEARYRVLAGLTSDYALAVWTRPDGTASVAWTTEAFERISGYAPTDVLTGDGYRTLVHAESRKTVRAALADLGAGGVARVEARITTRGGEDRWLQHSARLGETAADGSRLVYHSGQDVTERKRFEADLVAAREQAEASREKAEEMARLKSAFLANMSHEIRTPLTGILGYAELLADEVDPSQRDFVEAISTSGLRLLDTLNSVLDLARLEAEGIRPDLRPVDVAAEVRQAVRVLGPLASRRGLALDVDADGPAVASLDAACLGRIVTNLVGNALKFTETGGVRVSVDTVADGRTAGLGAGPRVRVRVADTGIGISDAFLPHLFDEFRQETDGEGRSHEGSGLGLSITQRLTGLMGGQVIVSSRRPGGSTFTVSFPARLPAAPPLAPALAPTWGVAPVVPPSLPPTPVPSPAVRLSVPQPPAPDRPAAPPDHSLPASPAPLARDSAPTAMLNFRFSAPAAASGTPASADEPAQPAAPSPAAPPSAEPAPQAAAPWSAPMSPYAPPAGWSPDESLGTPAPAPPAAPMPAAPPAAAPASAPTPAWPVDPADGGTPPVMIVRAAPPAPAAADPSDARLPILVVEDNSDTRTLLERILSATYAVTAVGDARSALAAMATTRFRGLVLDINLGGKETGTDVLRVARTLDGYADVYAAALTAYALPGDRERLLEAGFDEYISKPFTRQSLLDALAAGVRA